MLVWWEDEDAGKVVRVPRQLLLRKVPQDRIVIRVIWVGKDEDVEEERHDIEKHRFMVDEKLREERKVLRKQFILLPVYLPYRIPCIIVDLSPWWNGAVFAYKRVFRVGRAVA